MAITCVNIESKKAFDDKVVKKETLIKTDELSLDVYYFKPGQRLEYHKHPTGDQIFTVIKGEGVFFLDDGTENKQDVKPGFTFLAPKDVWHALQNTGSGELIAQQVTKQPAGIVART